MGFFLYSTEFCRFKIPLIAFYLSKSLNIWLNNTIYVIINLNELPIDVNMTFSKHHYYTHICNAKFDTNPYHVYVHVWLCVCMYVCMLYVCMYALKIASHMLFRYLDHCYQLLSSMILMMPSLSLLKGVPTYVCSANALLIHTGE